MVNFEAKTHTFLTLFPSLGASILMYCTGTGALFFESTPSIQKIQNWANSTVYRHCTGCYFKLRCSNVTTLDIFICSTCVLRKQVTYVLVPCVLWNGDSFTCLGKLVSDKQQEVCKANPRGFKRGRDAHYLSLVLRGSYFLRRLSSSQKHWQVRFWTAKFNSVQLHLHCNISATMLGFWKC